MSVVWRSGATRVCSPVHRAQNNTSTFSRRHLPRPVETMAYHLLQPDGTKRESAHPGTLGGNSTLQIYGRLDCNRAVAALSLGYARHRVFFADEAAAILAGYRPCARCMHEQYLVWKAGPRAGTTYPWRITPHHPMDAPTSLA
jgi:hypothetical protein